MKTYSFKNKADFLLQVENTKRKNRINRVISYFILSGILIAISALSLYFWSIILK